MIRAQVLVDDHEEGDELSIDVLGRPVRLGASAPRHDDDADQAGIDADACVTCTERRWRYWNTPHRIGNLKEGQGRPKSDFVSGEVIVANDAMRLQPDDALIVVDLQRDFCPGGALPVADGDKVVPLVNELIEEAVATGACVVASRDWHPLEHASFHDSGGLWPPHCVQGSEGAKFHADLRLPQDTMIVSKGEAPERDQYSAFDSTGLTDHLRRLGVHRVLIVGLAQEVCVRATAFDAVAAGFETHVRLSATRPLTSRGGRDAVEDLRNVGVVIEES